MKDMNQDNFIQCLWIGNQLSRMEEMCIRSYIQNAHTVHLYTYENIRNVPVGTIIMDANKIIPEDKIFKYKNHDSYAGFANLFRYKLLLEKGGYWTDMDNICLKTLTRTDPYIFASERRQNGRFSVNNCFIYATKGAEIMEYCYDTALSRKPEELNWGDTGPKLLTQAMSKYELYDYIVHPNVVCPVDWWNCTDFISKSISDVVGEDTYTIHLWNEMWRRNKMDKTVTYSENCVYEEIHKRYRTDQ